MILCLIYAFLICLFKAVYDQNGLPVPSCYFVCLLRYFTIELLSSYSNVYHVCPNRYFHHASGELFVISQALAQFVSINRSAVSTMLVFFSVWLTGWKATLNFYQFGCHVSYLSDPILFSILLWLLSVSLAVMFAYCICRMDTQAIYQCLFHWLSRSNLRTYAHDDVSVGSWFIGLDVKHIDERKFCCSSWASGLFLSSVVSCPDAIALTYLNHGRRHIIDSY